MSKTYIPSQLTRPAAPRSKKLRGLTTGARASSGGGTQTISPTEVTDAVRYTPQVLDTGQQMQARKNQGLYYKARTSYGQAVLWDGDTTDHEVVIASPSVVRYVRVASAITDAESLVGATQVAINDAQVEESTTFAAGDIYEGEGYIQAGDTYIVLTPDVEVNIGGNDVTFHWTGVWFADYYGSDYVAHTKSLTGLTLDAFFTVELSKIPQEFLPDTTSSQAVKYTSQDLTSAQQMQARKNQGLYFEEEQSTNYFKWDGNTTGLESVSVPSQIPSYATYYYRVSSQTPSYADLTGAGIVVQEVIEQSGMSTPAVQQGNCVLLVDQDEGYSMAFVISVLADNSQVVIGGNTLTFVHAGLYFMGFSPLNNQCLMWICQLNTTGNVLRCLVPTTVPRRFLPNDTNIVTCYFTVINNQTYRCSMSIADIFDYSRKMILVVGFYIDSTIRPVILNKSWESSAELVTMGTTMPKKLVGTATEGVDTWTLVG